MSQFAGPGVKAVDDKWYPEFPEYQKAAREMSLGIALVPCGSLCIVRISITHRKGPGKYWTDDGVHPNIAGIQLMATAWLEAAGGKQ